MKTIYLRAYKLADLIEDIKQVISNYQGEVEYEKNGIYCHYIGDIAITDATYDDDGALITAAVMVGAYHANLFVPEDFDTSIFNTENFPNTPVHQFA